METKEFNTPAEGSELSSPRPLRSPTSLKVFDHDIPKEDARWWRRKLSLGVDTETDGLLYRRDQLRLVQLADAEHNVIMVRNPSHKSFNLMDAMMDCQSVSFHHLMFDAGFMRWWTGLELDEDQVECTKIAAKILNEPKTSLVALLESYFDLDLRGLKEKSITKSNWNAEVLSDSQLQYAGIDVLYLHELLGELTVQMTDQQMAGYARAVKTALNKTYLEVEGFTDLLQYEHDNNSPSLKREWLKRAALMGL